MGQETRDATIQRRASAVRSRIQDKAQQAEHSQAEAAPKRGKRSQAAGGDD